VNQVRKQRLFWVIFIIAGVAIAVSLTLYALGQNLNAFYSPSQVVDGEVMPGSIFRMGGLVERGSVERVGDGLQVTFILTDNVNEMTVYYDGILPDLFREGQGIVTQGNLDDQGHFIATEVLAKHDENYMPAEVADILQQKG